MRSGNKRKGNILLVFIMVVALASIVFSFLTLMSTRLLESGARTSEYQAFNVAEAGLNKAIWLIRTPVSDGGNGPTWRTSGTTNSYGYGSYTFSITNTSTEGEVLIISTGEVEGIRKAVSQLLQIGLPDAFRYTIFGGSGVSIGRSFIITGDMFVNGNTVFSGTGTAGYVYHTAGNTVSGGGTDAGVPSPLPEFPPLDTGYYTNLINVARTYPSGNQTWSGTVNLFGGTIYVNGNVGTSWGTTINGPGTIVVSGTFNPNGAQRGNRDKVSIISGSSMQVTNCNISNTTLYSNSGIAFTNDFNGNNNVVLSVGNITTSGNFNIGGIMYSKTGSITLSDTSNINGALIAALGVQSVKGDIRIYYDASQIPSASPMGFSGGQYTRKTGSWKEL